MPFVGLAPLRLLRPNMAVLYHVNGKLQIATAFLLQSTKRSITNCDSTAVQESDPDPLTTVPLHRLATSRPHKFLSERSELFGTRSGRARHLKFDKN